MYFRSMVPTVLILAAILSFRQTMAQYRLDSVYHFTPIQDRYPSVSPNGKQIVFYSNRFDNNFEVYLANIDGTGIKRLTYNEVNDETPVWSPDNQKILFVRHVNGRANIMIMDTSGKQVLNVSRSNWDEDHPKFGPGNQIIYCTNEQKVGNTPQNSVYEIALRGADGTGPRKITANGIWNTYPSFSKDGRTILFRRILKDSTGALNSEIFKMNADGSGLVNLTTNPSYDAYPEFSPDGRWILFSSNRGGASTSNFRLFLMSSLGGSVRQLSFNKADESDVRASWFPDGKRIVFNREKEGTCQIMYANIEPIIGQAPFAPVVAGDILLDRGCSRGIAWGDYNNDGLADIAVANCNNQNLFLYQNKGNGVFSRIMDNAISEVADYSESVTWIDVDNDSDLDLFITTLNDHPDILMKNDSGRFTRVEAGELTREKGNSTACGWSDFDNDGDLDVYVVHKGDSEGSLFENLGDGQFKRVTASRFPYVKGDGRTCAWADVDSDGYMDLYVGNFLEVRDGVSINAQNYFFKNLKGKRFVRVEAGDFVKLRGRTYGVSFSDFDNDGDPDLFTTNIGRTDSNFLYINDGSGNLSKASQQTAGLSLHKPSKGHTWGDYDNDGLLDLFVANGTENMETEKMNDDLYFGDGNLFIHAPQQFITTDGEVSAGAAWADMDNDGDLDIMVTNWGGSLSRNMLYRNTTQHTQWLEIKLKGTSSNRFGIGTKVTLYSYKGSQSIRRTRWMSPQTGFASQNDYLIHFGLDTDEKASSIELLWPNGTKQTWKSPPLNRILTIEEGASSFE